MKGSLVLGMLCLSRTAAVVAGCFTLPPAAAGASQDASPAPWVMSSQLPPLPAPSQLVGAAGAHWSCDTLYHSTVGVKAEKGRANHQNPLTVLICDDQSSDSNTIGLPNDLGHDLTLSDSCGA